MSSVKTNSQTYLASGQRSKIDVHKLGGSSLRSATQIKRVAHHLLSGLSSGDIVVLSANGDITDWLERFYEGQSQYKAIIQNYIEELSSGVLGDLNHGYLEQFEKDLGVIEELIEKKQDYHKVVSFGEIWSVKLLETYCQLKNINVKSIEVTSLLKYTNKSGEDFFDKTYAKKYLNRLKDEASSQAYLVPGFIALNDKNKLITLGRNGSDYSATAIANLADAGKVIIWTDVDGIYSADPNRVDNAIKLEEISFCEAQALSELGANVLHQKTIAPLLSSGIEAFVKSSFIEGSSGTSIVSEVNYDRQVKTITFKNNLVRVQVKGISELESKRVQKKLLEKHLPSFANQYDKSKKALSLYVESNDVFDTVSSIKSFQFIPINCKKRETLISVVGKNIRQNKDVITKFLTRIDSFPNKEIYYPANSHTLCVFVSDGSAEVLLKDLHDTFFHVEPSIPIVILGYGNIGQKFVEIIADEKEAIEDAVAKRLSVVAVANSRYFRYSPNCLTLKGKDVISQTSDNSKNQVFKAISKYKNKELVIIDLTASEEIADRYLEFAINKWHIISANKIAASCPAFARKVTSVLKGNSRRWLKNTTVGAGLPIQAALSKLVESGDKIQEISGVFSGSLSWLFSQYDGLRPFSELLKEAQDNAYTEPDPREDLSGNDVIRKIRILASDVGFSDASEDFSSVISNNFLEGDLSDFWNKTSKIDEYVDCLYKEAKSCNGVLRYIARINKNNLSLKLEVVQDDHAFANLNPCDNVFSIQTQWYKNNPLIIQGPGAGREVTAAGVVNDLCDLLRSSS